MNTQYQSEYISLYQQYQGIRHRIKCLNKGKQKEEHERLINEAKRLNEKLLKLCNKI